MYHCDGNHGRIGKDKGHFVVHAPSAPVLSQTHPVWD